MKKKSFAAIALTACVAFGATLTGCSLVSTNNRLDMEQVVATVDISQSDKFNEAELTPYKNALSSTEILKRELVAYFLNVGYSYVQNGTSYEDTFNLLIDALVDNAVLVQYSTIELLKANSSVYDAFIQETDEAKKYELLLDEDDKNYATYKLYSSLNSAIDNFEKQVIDEESGYKGTGTRTTPTNLNSEQDNYYPYKTVDGKKVVNYGIYTGYGEYTLANSGAYQDDKLEGTTRSTRVKAYNSFLNNLRRNNLVDGDKEAETLTDVLALDYIKVEYVSQLKSRVINKYYELYEATQEERLLKGNYEYIDNVYKELLSAQTKNYGKSVSSFDSAMSSMSSTSFVLYSPETTDSNWKDFEDASGVDFAKFGFIYNILLPFSERQNVQLKTLQSIRTADGDDNYYFSQRNQLLNDIKTEDQRSVWFNGETDYAFVPEDGFNYFSGGKSYRNYLFFEDNLTDSGEGGRFKKLQAYDGRYSYNGRVVKNEDESYTLVPDRLGIDEMLAEFTAYVNYAVGSDCVRIQTNAGYYDTENFIKEGTEDEIDYSKLVYAEGKVDLGTFDNENLMNPDSPYYKAMSAVNELQFAYTTDTGVLSNYIGYSVTAYDTSYIKEFEYAAKKAVGSGVGSVAVCAGDYGWHLIYVTNVFEAGETYSPDWENKISVEGSFENLFFEWIKSNDLTDVSTTRRTKILKDFNKDSAVTKHQSRYQDLLDLGK